MFQGDRVQHRIEPTRKVWATGQWYQPVLVGAPSTSNQWNSNGSPIFHISNTKNNSSSIKTRPLPSRRCRNQQGHFQLHRLSKGSKKCSTSFSKTIFLLAKLPLFAFYYQENNNMWEKKKKKFRWPSLSQRRRRWAVEEGGTRLWWLARADSVWVYALFFYFFLF